MTCARCQTEPETLSVAFRSGLGWTEAADVCQPCADILISVVRRVEQNVRLVKLDVRPAWQRRDLKRDETNRGVA